jgi:hypothetical protein
MMEYPVYAFAYRHYLSHGFSQSQPITYEIETDLISSQNIAFSRTTTLNLLALHYIDVLYI